MEDVLRVNLTQQKFAREPLKAGWKQFLGGRGLGARIVFDEVTPDTDPLSLENKMVFTPGALNHSKIPFAGRHNVTSISPLTQTIFSSNCGAPFGAYLKTRTSALILEGRSPGPAYVVVGDSVEFRDASKVWGKDVFEATDIVAKAENVRDDSVAAIGPPAERYCYFANIVVEKGRMFGRGGMGAVLASKNVKAIVIKKGDFENFQILEKLRRYVKEVNQTPSALRTKGTSGILQTSNTNEGLPTRYFRQHQFEDAAKIDGDVLLQHKVGKDTCWSCMVACKVLTESKKYSVVTEGPEFESITSLGANSGISDFDSIIKSNELCRRNGLDTISAGNMVAALMEASEMKKVDYSIRFGDAEKIHEVLDMIAENRGVGKLMQKGVVSFAEAVGIEAVHVKGMDFPAHDGRGLYGQALSFATSNRGADHLYSTTYRNEYNAPDRKVMKGKAKKVISNENRNAVLDTLGICKFSVPFFTEEEFAEMLGVAQAKESATWEDLQQLGAAIVHIERKFNNLRGFTRKDDVLPTRVAVPGYEEELSEYYRLRGWSQDGIAP